MDHEEFIGEVHRHLKNVFSEKHVRLLAASQALSLGYGGVSAVHRATGISRPTIHIGIKELQEETYVNDLERIRHKGGGRTLMEIEDPTILSDLEKLLQDHTRGDPMRPLFWTNKSTENLALALQKMGHTVSDRTVARLLHSLNFSLQSNRKALEGRNSPERNAQFEYINKIVEEFQAKHLPVISVDAKKKELIGNFKNGGQEWRPVEDPVRVNVHDFVSGEKNIKAIPYGIYDVTWNRGWVSVGVDHDTATFAVESIRRWWSKMGKFVYPEAKELLITADSGGSNSNRGRLWKMELQKFADETGLEITVCHLPPGTSKWNKIEHRLFCHITKNWRARPLISYEVIISLIAHTATKNGLKVFAELDENEYPLAIKISNNDMKQIKIRRHELNSKWNYTISSSRNYIK